MLELYLLGLASFQICHCRLDLGRVNAQLCEGGSASAATHGLLYNLHMNGIIQLYLRNVSKIEVKVG